MMSDDIFIFSQNCQGLANMQKRRDLFHFVKSKKYNIICLQDIHIEKKMEPYVRSEWGYQVYMSPFRSIRRGVMILLRTYATKYFHIEIFSILCIQFVLCMGYTFMK